MRPPLFSCIFVMLCLFGCKDESLLGDRTPTNPDIRFKYPTTFAFDYAGDISPITVWTRQGWVSDPNLGPRDHPYVADFTTTLDTEIEPQLRRWSIQLEDENTLYFMKNNVVLDTFSYRIFQNEIYVDTWTQFFLEEERLRTPAFGYFVKTTETAQNVTGYQNQFFEDLYPEMEKLLHVNDTAAVRRFSMYFIEDKGAE